MWCETKARRPLPTQKVLFSSAPQPSTGRGKARATVTGWGTKPRERRRGVSIPPMTRMTESSVRMWMGRSWVRKASAMPRSRGSASSSR